MSKEITSQKMEMTCDACGAKKEWELVGADQNPTILQEMQTWYTLARKTVDQRTGQLTQLMGDACSMDCVTVLAVKLAVPPAQDFADNIDMDSLRVGNMQAN